MKETPRHHNFSIKKNFNFDIKLVNFDTKSALESEDWLFRLCVREQKKKKKKYLCSKNCGKINIGEKNEIKRF